MNDAIFAVPRNKYEKNGGDCRGWLVCVCVCVRACACVCVCVFT